MNTHRSVIRIPLMRTAISLALFAGVLSLDYAGSVAQMMTVQPCAPLSATLMPTVRVTARPGNPGLGSVASIDAREPLHVTLLPTVYVNARRSELLATTAANDNVDSRLALAQASHYGAALSVERVNECAKL